MLKNQPWLKAVARNITLMRFSCLASTVVLGKNSALLGISGCVASPRGRIRCDIPPGQHILLEGSKTKTIKNLSPCCVESSKTLLSLYTVGFLPSNLFRSLYLVIHLEACESWLCEMDFLIRLLPWSTYLLPWSRQEERVFFLKYSWSIRSSVAALSSNGSCS